MSQPPPPPNPPSAPPPEPGGEGTNGGFGPPPAGPPAGPPAPGAHSPTLGAGVPIPPPGGGQAPGTPPSAPPAVPGGAPGQPGYGYPQQPQPTGASPYQSPYQPAGAPTEGAGFGAPTPPGPYGAATGSWAGAPQGGAPGGPPPPPGPAKGSGGRRGGNRRLVVIAAVAAFALLVGGGGAVWLLSGDDKETTAEDDAGGDGGDGEGGDAEEGEGGDTAEGGEPLPSEPIAAGLAWELPSPEVSEEESIIDARGTWLTDDAFVRVTPDALVSYDLESGAENWSLPFEFSGGDCLPSRNVSENRIALLQGRDCEVLTVVDIVAGTEVMTIPIESEWPTYSDSVPAILGDTVAVGTGVAGLGFSISQEKMIWRPQASAECRESAYTVVDEMFVSQLTCGFAGDEGGSIRATDADGNELWEWTYEATYEEEPFEVESVVSVDPLVVQATVGEDLMAPDTTRLLVVDENYQEIVTELDFDTNRHLTPCETGTFDNCWLGVEHEGFLYLPSNVPYGDNAVEAFDLSTGRPLYEVPAINGGQILPFGVQDGQILAYQVASDALEGMVVAIDPETEEARPIMALDRAARPQEYALMAGIFVHDQHLLWQNNTLVLANRSFYSSDAPEVRSALVYR
ncbi:PQQ-binding-like beta-propeller repeat protein [Streptomyces johnsoniae]|uniref:PQQ-binding-like beta-propeller repeat protein n=1 Tax=Streptomyces johnsoniae TaxID=3075532 RepID=A0ABU2RYA4_9ACTN|nr:PQQ-binding-like beta-propeller repeat protein [Streptomyces sp. DSM 41886]MDT0441743.1 PQQ-binding-like beta-propeller repeat protein [Streptomyces sp. DSM 41886]